MTPDTIVLSILGRYPGVTEKRTWGERSLFYNPDGHLPSGTYFCTIKERDGRNDVASRLDREGVFRLNVGVSRERYHTLFGPLPARPTAGGVVATGHDFDQLDVIMPHPVYGWGAWICVLKPSQQTWEAFQRHLEEGYRLARDRFEHRLRGAPHKR